MPINLTSPTCDQRSCGGTCGCACGGMGAEPIAAVEARYPGEWLAFIIPPGEDEYAPEQGVLVHHSPDDHTVWAAVHGVAAKHLVHVYFNGPLDAYLAWAEAA